MGRRGCCFTFLCVLLLPLGFADLAQNPYWYCDPVNRYTPNTTFDHNLHRALASLVANVSITTFSNVTVGSFPDQVIATVQCRGDLDGEACLDCVSDSIGEIIQRCPSSSFAFFLVEECLLYYRDRPVPQQLEVVNFPSDGSLPNPQRFKPLLTSFFNNLILSATTNPSGRLFWGDKFYYTKDITIYGTAQCVQSLEMHDCISCLDMAFSQMINKDVDAAQGGAVFYRTVCLVRYETYPFFTPSSHKIDPTILNFIYSNCSLPTSSNMVATLFKRNLKVLLTRMMETGAVSSFYSDAVGSGSNQVYGQFLCRGDVPVDVCWNCSAQASSKILELCPNSRSAIVWLDYCQLRYSDVKFAGLVDVDDGTCQSAGVVNASNPAIFNQNLRILINNLISLATQSSPNRFFATGISALPDSTRIYALVQCVRDIPADRCRWCLQNASSDIQTCSNGKQTNRIYRGSCSLVFGVEPFFFGNATLPPVLPQPTRVNDQRRLLRITSTISATGGALIILIFLLLLLRIRKNYLARLRYNQDIALLYMRSPNSDESEREIPQICVKVIQDATANFSGTNKLGQGGYGHVYKGKLPNGQLVAVKRLSETSAQGLNEFKNEANLIAKLQHKNLVRLLGCCTEKGEKLLIYEYMPNKSLDGFLRDPEKRSSLNWVTRFDIIIGVARGILYLHQDSRLNIVHRDLKAANVLLDGQMNPKISDFGMARTFIGNQSEANTGTIAGTYGYMAPEYAMDGLFSIKSDVFSFGVLLLEIISGELNRGFFLPEKLNGLVGYAWSLWSSGQSLEFIDPSLEKSAHTEDILKCIHIALLCVQDEAPSRPTMSEVFLMLVSESRPLQQPAEPTFCVRKKITDPTTCCFLTQSELTPR